MSTATSVKSHTSQEQWKQQQNVVTHNDVIDAYLMGKKAGRTEYQKGMLKLFEDNLKKARTTSERLYGKLTELGTMVISLHLKAENLTDFIALVIVGTEDYVSDKFLQGIGAARSIKNEVNNEDFSIDFIYTFKAASLNEKALNSDGYFTRYGHK